MSASTVYRWEFRRETHERRVYAEAELTTSVPVGGPSHISMRVSLVRDEMQPPVKGVIDPDLRRVTRIHVGHVAGDDARLLAYLAPVEGERHAYTLIFRALSDNMRAVEKFGDSWLTDTLRDMNAA